MAKATKQKLRPYKVDYIDIAEIVGDCAPVHYRLVRVPTASEAKDFVARLGIMGNRVIIGARRFYKKLPKENPNPVAIEKLFNGVRAAEVMKQIASYYASGPTSPATQAVLSDLAGMTAHDEHEQTMDTFVPDALPPARFPTEELTQTTKAAVTVSVLDQQTQQTKPEPNSKIARPCPNCGQGMDTNGDGDCLVCTSPWYKQKSASSGRWLFSVIVVGTIVILTTIYIYQHLPH